MKKALLIAGWIFALGAVPPALLAQEPSRNPEAPPTLRLPKTARPLHYEVELTVLPEKETFSGKVVIDLDLPGKSSLLWLNGIGISVEEASISTGGKAMAARVVPGGEDFVGFAFERPVGPGAARLSVAYTGKMSSRDTTGIFRQKTGEDWYAFTQFEADDARRAFPCFDEPSYKVPWRLALTIPQGDIAVSNTPVAKEVSAGDGLRTVIFEETKPLPSYLVAFGIGPFDVVDAGRAGIRHVPIRMIVPRGQASEARYAVETTGQILALLEKYFGTPYPYAKLDNLVIPQTVRFGAMENAGLITYNERILLAKPSEETADFKRGWASVCAHETAHQWFGDWVTLAWWDDTWLNESFATWMSRKIVQQWKPEWDQPVSDAAARAGTMEGDSLVTARKIRQPIESKGDIDNAFDNISYGKGAAVLAMFEAWVGPEKFQKGVRRYLGGHAFGNATYRDFLNALEAEGGKGVGKAFATFLEQPGVPLVSLDLVCGGGAPRLSLSQKRLLARGASSASRPIWEVPVCVRYGEGMKSARTCRLLTAETAEMPLSAGVSCPEWILGNAGEIGYYTVVYGGDLLSRLLKNGGLVLTLPEKVGVLRDAATLADAGQMPESQALPLVPLFAKEENRHVVSATAAIAGSINDHLVPEDLRANYARFVRAMFSERARALSWNRKPGEDEDTQLLRSRLVGFDASAGEDTVLRQEARRLALLWLEDRKAVSPETVGSLLRIAAEDGDRALFDRFRAEAKKATERRDRDRLLNALGRFRDPAIAREALGILLTDEFDIRLSIAIFWAELSEPRTRQGAWDFFKTNFDVLLARLPREYGAVLPRAGGFFCDSAHRADVESFFRERAGKLVGAARALSQTLEVIDRCEALKAAEQDSVSAFLKNY